MFAKNCLKGITLTTDPTETNLGSYDSHRRKIQENIQFKESFLSWIF